MVCPLWWDASPLGLSMRKVDKNTPPGRTTDRSQTFLEPLHARIAHRTQAGLRSGLAARKLGAVRCRCTSVLWICRWQPSCTLQSQLKDRQVPACRLGKRKTQGATGFIPVAIETGHLPNNKNLGVGAHEALPRFPSVNRLDLNGAPNLLKLRLQSIGIRLCSRLP